MHIGALMRCWAITCASMAWMVNPIGNTVIAQDTAIAPIEGAKKLSRMDKRRLLTRNKLLQATRKLMLDKGVEKTTMTDISDAADLGRRTFYNHFASKEECIIAAAAQEIQNYSIRVSLHTAESKDPALVVATSTQFVMAGLAKEPIVRCLLDLPQMLGTALFNAIGEYVQQDMDAGIASGRFNPPLPGKLLDNMMRWSLVGLLIEAVDTGLEIETCLVGYSQALLMMLGLPNSEACEVSRQAARALSSAELI